MKNHKFKEPSAKLRLKQNQSARGRFSLTTFQLRVLEEALKIPFGEIRSYRFIARRIGSPRAVRAVGTALKNNPYPLLIPCHRVVTSGGQAGGYSRGKEIKKQLLSLEKRLQNIFCQNRKKAVSS